MSSPLIIVGGMVEGNVMTLVNSPRQNVNPSSLRISMVVPPASVWEGSRHGREYREGGSVRTIGAEYRTLGRASNHRNLVPTTTQSLSNTSQNYANPFLDQLRTVAAGVIFGAAVLFAVLNLEDSSASQNDLHPLESVSNIDVVTPQ